RAHCTLSICSAHDLFAFTFLTLCGPRRRRLLRLSRSDDDQHHATHKGERAEDRRQENGLLLLLRDLERPKVYDLLSRRVRDALVGERDHAENDQNDTDKSHGFHGALLSFLVMRTAGAGRIASLPPGESRSHAPSYPARTRRPDAGYLDRGPAPSQPSLPQPQRPPPPSYAPRASCPPRTPPCSVPTATRLPP